MTFTIELDDELTRQLQERAAQTQMTPQQMAVEGLRDFLKSSEPQSSTQIETASDDEFEAAVRYTLDKNAELYRRLA